MISFKRLSTLFLLYVIQFITFQPELICSLKQEDHVPIPLLNLTNQSLHAPTSIQLGYTHNATAQSHNDGKSSKGLTLTLPDLENNDATQQRNNSTNQQKDIASITSKSPDNYTVCSKAADLVFLLDSSESVKFRNWNLTLQFVRAICDRFALNSTRYAIVRFASDAEVELPLTSFKNSATRDNAIEDIFYKTGGTRTDIALQKAAEVLQIAEKRKASQVVILVTDGPSNQLEINKNHFVEGKDLVQGPADILKQDGVALFTIGIEPDSETPDEITTMKEELEAIASEPTHGHVFIADGYRELETKVQLISQAACVVNGAWSSWSEFSPCSVTCGFGTKVRMRTCTNPLPANNGAGCTGPRVETQQCGSNQCRLIPISLPKANATEPNLSTEDNVKHLHQNVVEEGQKESTSAGCPQGFEEIHIDGNQLHASSIYGSVLGNIEMMKLHDASNGLLNNIKLGGSWCADHQFSIDESRTEYLEVDFKDKERITMVATQGSHSYDNWVKKYILSYSDDGVSWTSYNNETLLHGNSDRNTLSKQILSPDINARHVRLYPQEWNTNEGKEKHDICLRVGFFSCKGKTMTKRDIKNKTKKTTKAAMSTKRILNHLHKVVRHILVRKSGKKKTI